MQNNQQRSQHSVHQYIERLMRHRLAILLMVGFMAVAILHFDARFANTVRQAYDQGFGWIGTYTRHEHPTHGRLDVAINRVPTTSSA